MKLFKVIHEYCEDNKYSIQEKLVTAADFKACAEAEIAGLVGYEHCLELKQIIDCGSIVANYVSKDEGGSHE